jgi:hypothetical protein
MMHVLVNAPKKVTNDRVTYFAIVTNRFEPQIRVDYSFQYVYRIKAISKYYWMEFLAGLWCLYFFFQVNDFYVGKFKGLQKYFKTTYNITSYSM